LTCYECLAGAIGKEGLAQKQFSEFTGVPQRNISEMENDKRPIGKEIAKKLGKALNIGYKVFFKFIYGNDQYPSGKNPVFKIIGPGTFRRGNHYLKSRQAFRKKDSFAAAGKKNAGHCKGEGDGCFF